MVAPVVRASELDGVFVSTPRTKDPFPVVPTLDSVTSPAPHIDDPPSV